MGATLPRTAVGGLKPGALAQAMGSVGGLKPGALAQAMGRPVSTPTGTLRSGGRGVSRR
jgi:hypothetical protein